MESAAKSRYEPKLTTLDVICFAAAAWACLSLPGPKPTFTPCVAKVSFEPLVTVPSSKLFPVAAYTHS